MRYLLMFQFSGNDTNRVINDAPEIIRLLSHFSNGRHEVAYRSRDGMTFGFFFESEKDPSPLQKIMSASSAFANGDGMIVAEVGDLKAGYGMTRQWTWLQHHL